VYSNSNFGMKTPSLSSPQKFNVVANLTYDTPNQVTTVTSSSSINSPKNETITSASASQSQSISTLNIPELPKLLQTPKPSPSFSTENNDNNNNVNLVIDIPIDNAESNFAVADNSSTHSMSPSNPGSM
jgi:hypothetical protein